MTGDPTEAEIRAVWPQYEIPDLDLKLRAGQRPVYRPKAQAQASKRFVEGVNMGAIEVRWVKRCKVSKPKLPAPPTNRRIKPVVKETPKEAVQVDEEALAERVAKKLDAKQQARDRDRDRKQEQFQAEVLRRLGEQKGQNIDIEALQAMLKGAVTEAVESAPVRVVEGSGGGTVKEKDSGHTPYIPSQIVRDDVKTSITAKESSTDAAQTDDAVRKLREKRRKKDA